MLLSISYYIINLFIGVKFTDCRTPLMMSLGGTRSFSEQVTHMPEIKDPEIERAFKDLMAENWDEIPDSILYDVKKALSKNTDDKAGQEVLKTVFCSAEAVELFTGMIMNIKMEIDDSIGMSGEVIWFKWDHGLVWFFCLEFLWLNDLNFMQDVKPLPEDLDHAIRTVYQRYITYLNAFGPEESYLRKKVETELGSKMIFLKMRCSGLGSEWGKVLSWVLFWLKITLFELRQFVFYSTHVIFYAP